MKLVTAIIKPHLAQPRVRCGVSAPATAVLTLALGLEWNRRVEEDATATATSRCGQPCWSSARRAGNVAVPLPG
jgi:hypothetical protein